MKIVVLDGSAVNPGDLSWDCFQEFGEITIYEHTPIEKTLSRINGADIVKLNNSVNMQNVMVHEEKDIFVYEKDAYFYNSIVYRFRASKLTDELLNIIKETIIKR